MLHGEVIDRIKMSAYKVPTDAPEADGTYEWSDTTLVVAEVGGCGQIGFGYTYGNAAVVWLVADSLATHVLGRSASSPRAAWHAMMRAVRNNGRQGIGAMAISTVDCALWDLKAKLLGVSMADLLGTVRESIPVYGSGGFTSYSDEQLRRQLSGWVNDGIPAVKIKIGARPECDLDRVQAAREVIGDAGLFVDANGAYDRKQALHFCGEFVNYGVSWFEEPVSSDDLEGLRIVRDRAPAELEIAAGEYGNEQAYFRRMMEAQAVDVVQVDATRCGGVTGFLKAAEEIDSFGLPLSAHTAPSLHASLCCAVSRARHVEYFHDHVRIESALMEGALSARGGRLRPDRSAPGFGLSIKAQDAERFLVCQREVSA